MTPVTRAVRLVLTLCVAVLLTGACGVPTSGPVSTIDPTAVPYGLSDPGYGARPGGTPGAATRRPGAPAVYFVDADDRLVVVRAGAGSGPAVETLSSVLAALVAGPDEQQRARGLRTLIAPGGRIRVDALAGSVARIDVRLGDRPPAPEALPLLAGQIVLTATSVPGVRGVRLVDAGQPLPTPLPGGGLVDRAVTARDYASLLPSPASTTSTAN